MALPPGIQAKTVTLGIASFADGSLATGRATISMPVNVIHTPTNRPIFSSEITKPFVDGEVSFDLLPTDAPGLNRVDWAFKLRVEIAGATTQPEVLYFLLPTAGPDVVDLDGLVTVPSSAGIPISVTSVTSVNGMTGDVTVEGGTGGGSVVDATTSTKGVVQLAGDLGGTAAAPTVPGLASKVNSSTYTAGLAGKQDKATLGTDVAALPELSTAIAATIADALDTPPVGVKVTATQTVTNTVDETTILSYTLPGGTVKAGDTFHIRAVGQSDSIATSGTLTFRLRIGTVLAWEAVVPTQASVKNFASWSLDALLAFRADAAASVVQRGGGTLYSSMSNSTLVSAFSGGNVDLSVDQPITVSAKWATAATGNTVRAELGFIRPALNVAFDVPAESPLAIGTGKVLALGTSIAWGGGASNPATTSYPPRTAYWLNQYLGHAFTVVNGGVTGDNTTQMLARLPGLLSTHKPTCATIEVSTNDGRSDLVTTAATTEANLRKMIALCRLAGAEPVLLTAAQYDAAWWTSNFDTTSAVKLMVNNATARRLATELGVQLVDIFEVTRNKVDILYDGLHPNDAGHEVWAKAIAQKIAAMIVINAQTVLTEDTFDRADAATLGADWTDTGAKYGIAGNVAYVVDNTDQAMAWRETGQNDHVVSAVVAAKPGGGRANLGLMARVTDDGNHYLLDLSGATPSLFKKVAWSFTSLAAVPESAYTVGDEVALMVDGSHISVWVNGQFVAGATDSALPTGTKAGLWNAASDGSSRWASFRVTA